jgi:hypothetical protein
METQSIFEGREQFSLLGLPIFQDTDCPALATFGISDNQYFLINVHRFIAPYCFSLESIWSRRILNGSFRTRINTRRLLILHREESSILSFSGPKITWFCSGSQIVHFKTFGEFPTGIILIQNSRDELEAHVLTPPIVGLILTDNGKPKYLFDTNRHTVGSIPQSIAIIGRKIYLDKQYLETLMEHQQSVVI